MNPVRSYRIWFAPRSGSTLLCKALASTGFAGNPEEFFNLPEGSTLAEKYSTPSFQGIQAAIWQQGTTPNGVFGIKHSLFADLTHRLTAELLPLWETAIMSGKLGANQAIWDALFPNCQHIFLTRRNKVRQAVSWWKAIKTEQWQMLPSETPRELGPSFYEDHYDVNALNHLLKETVLRECATQAAFERLGIQPLTLVYEDMVQDFKGCVRNVLSFLDLPAEKVSIPPPNALFSPTADNASEKWVQRFREDLQRGMTPHVW